MRPLTCLIVLFLAATLSAAPPDDFKREGSGPTRLAKDALEDKQPPALQVNGWLNTDGKAIKLEDFKGKVVLIDFWGVWCGPCRAAMPKLKDLHTKYKDEGLVIIGIHTSNQGDRMAAFVEEQKIPWAVAIDVGGATVKRFKVDSYPDYYVIDRSGKLRVADLQNGEVERVVQVLLKEKP